MHAVPITKMHGAYNDFIVIDERIARIDDLPSFAKTVCNRRGSVGADGVLVISACERADVRMSIFNADGSQAEMCGNGARCVARYLSELGAGDNLVLETAAREVQTSIVSRDPFQVRVNLGVPRVEEMTVPDCDCLCVWVGNPHVVALQPQLREADLPGLAQALAATPQFRNGTNVHAAVKIGTHQLEARHYERGVGPTMACGSGAVASAAAAISRNLVRSPVEVQVPGGQLLVEWEGGDAFLTGPAVRVFDTELALST